MHQLLKNEVESLHICYRTSKSIAGLGNMIVAFQHRSSEIGADCLRLIYVQRCSSRSWTSVIHIFNKLNKDKRRIRSHFADTKNGHLTYINLLYFHSSNHCCKTNLLLNSIIRGSSFFVFFIFHQV